MQLDTILFQIERLEDFASQKARMSGVIRIMDEQYIDEFLDTGKLRLSSFYQFARHANEIVKDANEGANILLGTKNNFTIYAVTQHGYNSYVLCGTTNKTAKSYARFKSNFALYIKDTTAFAIEVSHKIEGMKYGFEGSCDYQGNYIECDIEHWNADMFKRDITTDHLRAITTMGREKSFFKKSSRFVDECEYRWIWLVDHNIPPYTVIYCPEARQYCEKVRCPI